MSLWLISKEIVGWNLEIQSHLDKSKPNTKNLIVWIFEREVDLYDSLFKFFIKCTYDVAFFAKKKLKAFNFL